MYKININDNILWLCDSNNIKESNFSKTALISPYKGKSKQLLSFIDMMEKTNRFNEVIIHYHDFKSLKKTFKSLFNIVKASGGVVKTPKNEVLMIYRRGFWDLPKGKIDKGEKKKEAAIREVEEETGIRNIKLLNRICKTNHTYRLKSGKRAIKLTYWYAMESESQNLIPQHEEDIELAKWVLIPEFIKPGLKIYNNILEVLKKDKRIKDIGT